jgi:hypothetical protein
VSSFKFELEDPPSVLSSLPASNSTRGFPSAEFRVSGPFYTSAGPPAGLLVQTNPIWRDARWGLPPRAWRAPVVQTNQIPPVATGLAVQTNPIRGQPDGRRGSIMRQRLVARCRSGNKAKLGRPWGIWGPARGGSLSCETKPISRRSRTALLAARPSSLAPAKSIAQNQPNLPGGAGRDGACGTRAVGQMCKTNPIPAVGLDPRRRSVQNKPDLWEPTGPRGRLYKQSQFTPHRPGRSVAGRSGCALPRGDNRPKQTQLFQSDINVKYLLGKGL